MKRLKNYFIGIDLEKNTQGFVELMAVSTLGGENSEIFNCTNYDVTKIFEKIKISI